MAMLQLGEITEGLVVYLSHSELEQRGYRIVAQRPDRHGHLFLCIGTEEKTSTWVMLTSRGYFGRYELTPNVKYGHPSWVNRRTFVCGRETVLRAETWDVQVASVSDPSREHSRNWVDPDVVNDVQRQLMVAVPLGV